eukprot:TRINITY_DN2325_c0_g4_i1.p1 TRINITY_DN2325_c0_g4~~TRINITY_DN2325_c0_g4_i1.p1  ORF type:complete len:1012 (+),score=223.43 TRINITY_DN2325_c0_g4_i1:326-3361(+)
MVISMQKEFSVLPMYEEDATCGGAAKPSKHSEFLPSVPADDTSNQSPRYTQISSEVSRCSSEPRQSTGRRSLRENRASVGQRATLALLRGSSSHTLRASHRRRQHHQHTQAWQTAESRSQRRTPAAPIRDWARRVVDHKYFVATTTLLTVYALVGDDLKMLYTSKPADPVFDILTLLCLLVFTLEVLLSCIGKPDYPGSFFFTLDVVSTLTLVLDISVVLELASGQSEANADGGQMRSGKTARLGAKAGRVVRVLRLVRILKLYKAVYEARASRRSWDSDEDDDDWGDEGEEPDPTGMSKAEPAADQESRVGKRLSELTTRRVIILVLTMLFLVPFLRVDLVDQAPSSSNYGADDIWEAFEEWRVLVNASGESQARRAYENRLLKYMHYHNWFNPTVGDVEFLSALFWVGIRGTDARLVELAPLLRVRPEAVTEYTEKVAAGSWLQLATFPSQVLPVLSSPWTSECDIGENIHSAGFSLLRQKIGGYVEDVVRCPVDLRSREYEMYSAQSKSTVNGIEARFSFYFDKREFVRQEAIFALAVTFSICVILVVASVMFTSDANRLVLHPLDNMVARVKKLRQDPLVAMKMADDEFRQEEKKKAKMKQQDKLQTSRFLNLLQCSRCFKGNEGRTTETMETVILEKTIIKLGSLLALGFGEAGANIIGHNLSSSDTAGVNVMIPGTRVECIIGRARILDFSIATEVLQANIMTFVNQIAEIVHGIVDQFHGAANKNNGDTFLLIWRLFDLLPEEVERFADMSVCAFASIYGAVNRSLTLSTYRTHPGLQNRLGKDCRVRLSFGMHAGWAIEGAVGTEFKIDASYLSPNVSIATTVESATSIYKVPILIAESLHGLMTPKIASQCRLIDRVIIRGSPLPMNLYSLDLDYRHVKVDSPRDPKIGWNSRTRFKIRQYLEAEKMHHISPEVQMSDVMEAAEDIWQMRRPFKAQFTHVFNMGYQNYALGEWQVAKRLLSDTRNYLSVEDGPSAALISFMESYKFKAPDSWQGVRELNVET